MFSCSFVYCQKITFNELSKGVENVDNFLELITQKDFILSSKKEQNSQTMYSMAEAKSYDTNLKTTDFWVFVVSSDKLNYTELQFGDHNKVQYNYFVNYFKTNCKKVAFVQEEYCNCFVTTYEKNGVKYDIFRKESDNGQLSYHITAERKK